MFFLVAPPTHPKAVSPDLSVSYVQVLLCITYSPNFDINGDSILRIAQVPSASCPDPEEPEEVEELVPSGLPELAGTGHRPSINR